MNELEYQHKVLLKDLCTMRTGGPANSFVEIYNEDQLLEVVKTAKEESVPIWIVGRGSNTVFTAKGFSGLVIKYLGDEIVQEDDHRVTVGAGREWDEVVEYVCMRGLSGIEMLSLIPGHCGAAPVQNIGAYGQQLSDVLVSVRVLDLKRMEFYTMSAEDCDLSYRESRFKRSKEKNFIITAITMQLSPENTVTGKLYKDIEALLEESNQDNRSPASLREATITVRKNKLPDPNITPNSGSFFKNPVISGEQHQRIVAQFPALDPWESKIFGTKSQGFWPLPDGTVKVAAGMLMEHSGFADFTDPDSGFATWPTQALCITNPSLRSAQDLLAFVNKIQKAMFERYGLELEIEPEFVGE